MKTSIARRFLAALATLTTAVLPLFLLWGCGARPRDGRVHITLWSGWTGNEEKSFQKMVDRFNAAHRRIYVDNLGGVQDDTRTIRAITAGVPPDLFFLWSPSNLGPLVANGAVRPLDVLMKRSGMPQSALIPAALAMGRVNGRIYSLPYLVDCEGLFWNRAVFKEAGLDPDGPPQTMQDLAALAIKLTRRDPAGHLTRLGLDLPDIQLVMAVFGGRLLDERGNVTANDPRNVAAFQWYLDLVRGEGGVSEIDSFTSGYGQGQGPNHPFFVGKTAMMISGEWIPWWVEKYAPQVRYGLASVPFSRTYPAGRGTTIVGGNPLCIPTESKHPAEAWEFIRWTQSPEAQSQFARALNNVPNIRAVLHDRQLTQGSLRMRNYGKFLQFASSPNATVIPASPLMNYYLAEIEHARDFVAHGDKTPQQALSDVQQKVTAEMRRFGEA